jgi:hypothetical protein
MVVEIWVVVRQLFGELSGPRNACMVVEEKQSNGLATLYTYQLKGPMIAPIPGFDDAFVLATGGKGRRV